MIESFIYHAVIAIFIVLMLIFYFKVYSESIICKNYIVPFFCRDSFTLPKDRSLFVRGVSKLQLLLSKKYATNIIIETNSIQKEYLSRDFHLFGAILFGSSKNSLVYFNGSIVLFQLLEKKILICGKNTRVIFKQVLNNNQLFWEVIFDGEQKS